ncbi:MAG: hypothetical protein RLZZ612_351 [Pseudomonadota bacterium]|jgi:uncharacterized protein YigA (DUF484 family)
MSSTPNTPPSTVTFTEDALVKYLLQHPHFFERHAQVLASVQLTSPHSGRAVSLLERQAEMLREKIRTQELTLGELIHYGKVNTEINHHFHQWLLPLLREIDPAAVPQLMSDTMEKVFKVPQVSLRVWDVAPAWAQLPLSQGCSEEVRSFASSLPQPFVGRNPGLDVAKLLPDPAAAQSLALIPLRESGEVRAFGLLLLASHDPQRFQDDMEVDFLVRMGEAASAALHRLRA